MLESWGCGLYTSAAYTRVFTVNMVMTFYISAYSSEKFCKSKLLYSQEHFFPVYITLSKHLEMEKIPKVMQTFECRSGFHNCLELSEPRKFSDRVMAIHVSCNSNSNTKRG